MGKSSKNTAKNQIKPNKSPRALAALSLERWEKQGKYATLETVVTGNRADMSPEDKGLYTALVFGVVERAITLDHIIDDLSERPAADLDVLVRNALRLGLYQLIYMDRIPEHAAVSESVEIVPKKAAGFVNAILRGFIRGGKKINLPSENDTVRYLSVKYSVPEKMCRHFIDSYGYDDACGILESSFGGDRLCLRVNTFKCSMEDAVNRLESKGVSCAKSAIAEDVLLISGGKEFLSGIDEGLWFVQDEASALAVQVLDPTPDSTVIDLCAAPGGKSFGSAVRMGNSGRVLSFDIHENKLSLIRSGAEKMGLTIISASVGDGKNPAEEILGSGDFVICDAPCSGLGVMSKKPDIRYKDMSQVAGLPEVQYDILRGAAKCVKPGGVLLYSTCTLNPRENEDIVRRFLEEYPDFVPVPFDVMGMGDSGFATLMPHKTGTDGFFISKFRRVR